MPIEIGHIIRNAREEKGLSQSEFAKMIGVSKLTIIRLEKNQRKPTFHVFCRLVHFLDVSADIFIRSDRAPLSVEQEQFISEFLDCDKHERRVVVATIRSLLGALRHDESEKQD